MRWSIANLTAIVLTAACGFARDPTSASIRPQSSDEIVLTITVRDTVPADALSVTAFTVYIDDQPSHEVLVVPGSGLASYETLIGPLSAADHTVVVKPSSRWSPNPEVRVTGTNARTITSADPAYDTLRFAPALALRSDTVGTANDLPMLLYVEERNDAARVLRYTTVFTNEDGGTETAALFARWGRGCDIEETYEIRLDPSGQTIAETFQGPQHETMSFNGIRMRDHPTLTVATRNNMFMDNRIAGVMVRPVPIVIQSGIATRESVLDDRPWLQRLTARELAAEQKPFDPRDFVYLEADVRVGESAAAAAWVQQADGTRVSSDRGDERLRVTRDGWVRVAVPLARDISVTAAGWSCLPRKDRTGPCQIQPGRVFKLSDDFEVQSILIEPPRTTSNLFEPPRTRLRSRALDGQPGADIRRVGVGVQALATR
jgi:hypothetical protein